jgi:glycosyltransferase involved in cell wall biosynthesis
VAWHRDLSAARVDGVVGPRRLPAPRRALAELWRRGTGPAPSERIVHAPTPLIPPVRRGRRLVVTVHDAVPWTHPETLTPRGAAWHRDMGERIARDADVVVVPTAAVAEELRAHIRPRRVEVIGEGVAAAVAVVPPDADERARRLGLPDHFALVVGTLEPRKGLDIALGATGRPGWPPGLDLVVVGPRGWGDLRLPEKGRAHLLGKVSDADLAVAYARAAAVLVPSRSEGFGLPVLEAMTHGTPVVVTTVPALLEVGADAVVPVPVGEPNALAEGVAEALAASARLGAAGRRRAGAYSWERAASACRDIYVSLG